MLKRSIISVQELYENLPVVGDSTKLVICDELHIEVAKGFWFDDSIAKYMDMVVEEFRYSAVHDKLYVYLLEYREPADNSAAY